MRKDFSAKRIAIDKANATLVVAVAVAAFIIVFSLVASKAFLDQRAYQSKVISQKEKALQTLKNNVVAADQLIASYQVFINEPVNAIGGNPTGDADRDGDNARIVLDALPSKYDFPGLTTSIDKLFKENGLKVTSLKGNDDEVAQAKTDASESPQPIEMPFTVEIKANASRGKFLLDLFEKSIRPFQIKTIAIEGEDSELEFTIEALTYFQPEKNLEYKTEVVK
ncbi:hypothetical protein KY385_03960 [Candidatus Parcubacteria bacterium]|nr:hypothetical protein [Candidatus Parcubacteria bacterium]